MRVACARRPIPEHSATIIGEVFMQVFMMVVIFGGVIAMLVAWIWVVVLTFKQPSVA